MNGSWSGMASGLARTSARLAHLASAAGNRIQAMTCRTPANFSRRRSGRSKQIARRATNVSLCLILFLNGCPLSAQALRECRMGESGHQGDQDC